MHVTLPKKIVIGCIKDLWHDRKSGTSIFFLLAKYFKILPDDIGFSKSCYKYRKFFFRCTHSQVVLSGSKVLLDFWIFLQHPYFTHTHTQTHTPHTLATHSSHTQSLF